MRTLKTLMLALVAVAAAAVAGAALAETTLTYYTFTTDQPHVATLKSLIADFEAQNPDIKIQYTAIPFDNYFTKLQTDFAAGNPPDVFELNYENFVTFASRGTLASLAGDMAGADGIASGTFNDAALKAFSYQGTQYGLPITFSTVVLFYNKDLFDAAGVAYPTNDWTWTDVVAAAKKLTDPAKRVWGIYQPIQFWEFYKVAAQAGGGLQVSPEVKIDTPANQRALHYLVDKVRTEKIMPTEAQLSGVANEDFFLAGHLAMDVSGIWMFDKFKAAKFAWDIAVEPGSARKATHFFANAAAIAQKSAHKEAAWKWVKFLASAPAVAKARIATNWELPPLSVDRLKEDGLMQAYLAKGMPSDREAVFRSLAYAVTPPVVADQPKLQDIINQELEAASLGTKTVEQALADAQKRVEALVKNP
jgi:multiple sugar transport system substrate-binding protein